MNVVIAPQGAVVWLPSEYAPEKTSPETFQRAIHRENVAAALAASECGTAKLERMLMLMLMLMNDELCPCLLSLRNTQKFAKIAQVIGNQDILAWRKSVGPSY